MTQHLRIAKTIVLSVVLAFSFLFSSNIYAQPNGQALFLSNCASCHAVHKDLTGPALAGVEERWGNTENLHAWIKNSAAYLKTGDPYAVGVYEEWKRVSMPPFPLADEEIDAILAYIKTVPAVKPPTEEKITNGESDNTLLYGILTLVLAIVVLILLQVNSNLRKLSAEKQGEVVLEPLPFWRNKAYIATFTIILFCIGGYLIASGAMGLGRSQNYQPEQPIY